MERTWAMGIVRVTLSSPASWISLPEVEMAVPLTLVPSLISTVACWPLPLPAFRLQEERITDRKKIEIRNRFFMVKIVRYV
jgi:hypothetical protein